MKIFAYGRLEGIKDQCIIMTPPPPPKKDRWRIYERRNQHGNYIYIYIYAMYNGNTGLDDVISLVWRSSVISYWCHHWNFIWFIWWQCLSLYGTLAKSSFWLNHLPSEKLSIIMAEAQLILLKTYTHATWNCWSQKWPSHRALDARWTSHLSSTTMCASRWGRRRWCIIVCGKPAEAEEVAVVVPMAYMSFKKCQHFW